MLIDKTYKIEEAVSLDSARGLLCHAYLEIDAANPEKGTLVATDGHMLACAPVKVDEGDTAGPVSPEALERARKLVKGRNGVATLSAGADHKLEDGSILPRPNGKDLDGTPIPYPDWRQVVPACAGDPAGPGRFTVGVNIDLLTAAAKAIGAKYLRLTFMVQGDGETLAPIKVEPSSGGEGQFALVMPMRP